jgi:predicted outer membrane repeat protein
VRDGGQCTMGTAALLSSNRAFYDGGGLHVGRYGIATIGMDASVERNHADAGGGAFVEGTGVLSVTDARFAHNTVDGSGGAIAASRNADVSLLRAVLSNNVAQASGGGVYITCKGFRMAHSEIENNTATVGGGLACDLAATVEVDTSVLSSNTADAGGGMAVTGTSVLDFIDRWVGEYE